MKIAFTSQNFRTITGHAGKCNRFLILEQADGELREAARIDLPKEMAFHSFAGGAHPVDGCAVLVTQSCGAGFVHKLAARNIRVLVTGETDPWKAAAALLRGVALPPPDSDHGHDHHQCGCGSH
jgi:predicted Fe-Mo cluster-binding NifX family protein